MMAANQKSTVNIGLINTINAPAAGAGTPSLSPR
jgi:hypothetical protein